jgi:hypothetical protein
VVLKFGRAVNPGKPIPAIVAMDALLQGFAHLIVKIAASLYAGTRDHRNNTDL